MIKGRSRSLHEQLYLGIDGGASNTTVAIFNDKRQLVYQQKTAGGANYHALGLETAMSNLEQAIQLAIDDLHIPPPVVFDRAVFGLAGINFDSDTTVVEQALRRSSLGTMLGGGFEVVNDSQVALRAGNEDNVGIVLIAGTGSNCYGRNDHGKQARSGGLDHILSDEGSGYDIGLRAIKAVVRSLDGRSEPTKLTKVYFEMLHVTNLDQFHQVIYDHYATKPAIASLAEAVSDVAEHGDSVAQDILNHSANELLRMVDAVMQQLDWRDSPLSLVLVGSVVSPGSYVRRRLEMELHRINPQARTITPGVNPAVGACLLAWQKGR